MQVFEEHIQTNMVVGPLKEGVQAIAAGGATIETVVKAINAVDAVQSVVSTGTEVSKEVKKDQATTSENPPVIKQ